jgi:hypothetical protein
MGLLFTAVALARHLFLLTAGKRSRSSSLGSAVIRIPGGGQNFKFSIPSSTLAGTAIFAWHVFSFIFFLFSKEI